MGKFVDSLRLDGGACSAEQHHRQSTTTAVPASDAYVTLITTVGCAAAPIRTRARLLVRAPLASGTASRPVAFRLRQFFGRCIAGHGFGGNMGYFNLIIGTGQCGGITCLVALVTTLSSLGGVTMVLGGLALVYLGLCVLGWTFMAFMACMPYAGACIHQCAEALRRRRGQPQRMLLQEAEVEPGPLAYSDSGEP